MYQRKIYNFLLSNGEMYSCSVGTLKCSTAHFCSFETGSTIVAATTVAVSERVREWVSACYRVNYSTTITATSRFTHFSKFCCMCMWRSFTKCTNCFAARNANRKTCRPINDMMRERENSIRGAFNLLSLSLLFYHGLLNVWPLFSFIGGVTNALFYVNKILCHFSSFCFPPFKTELYLSLFLTTSKKELPSSLRFFVCSFLLVFCFGSLRLLCCYLWKVTRSKRLTSLNIVCHKVISLVSSSDFCHLEYDIVIVIMWLADNSGVKLTQFDE